MLRATAIVRKAAIRADSVTDTVSLDHAGRQGAPAILTGAKGLSFTLALQKPSSVDDGDAFRLEDGRLVTVHSVAEALLEVRAENPARLMRLSWQLGGNHVSAEIGADVLYVPNTAANAELIRGQGCAATPVSRAFKPERESHDHSQCGHDHEHGHSDDHGHSHDHVSSHTHDHADHGHASHNHDHGHVHGPDCKHDH